MASIIFAALHPHLDFSSSNGSSTNFATIFILFGIAAAVFLGAGAMIFLIYRALRNQSQPKMPTPRVGPTADTIPEVAKQILTRKVARRRIVQFWDGLWTPWDGMRLMNADDGTNLWRYSIAPGIISLLVTACVIAALVTGIASASGYVHDQFESTWTGRILEVITFTLIVASAIGIAFIVWLVLQMVLCGYFWAKLVVKVELLLGTPETELQETSFFLQLWDNVIDVSKLIAITLGLVLLNIVPFIGSLCAAAGGAICDCLFAGYEFLDFPMVARGIRRKQRRQFAKQHLWHTLGLGTSVIGLALIPGLGAVLLSTAAAGSALLYRRLAQASTTEPWP